MKVAERKGRSRCGGSRREGEVRAGGVEGSSVAVVGGSISILSFVAILVAGCVHSSGTSDTVAAPLVPADQAQTTASVSASGVRAVLDQYCVRCHNERIVNGEDESPSVLASQLRESGMALDILDVTRPGADAEAWERVIRRLRTGTMPPAGRPRPDEATYDAVASSLEAELDRAWEAAPNPGRVNSVHRLNRTEYNNAIRDLFALDIDVKSLLPGDETADGGFDNNADVLSITMSHVERYMSVARQVTRLATSLPPTTPSSVAFDVSPHLVQNQWRQSDDLPLGSRGGVAVRYPFPVDGEYLIKVRLQTQYADFIKGMGWPQQLDILLDGKLLRRFVVGGEAPGTPATASNAGRGGAYPRPGWDEYMKGGADDGLEISVPVDAGTRVVGVAFVRDVWEPEFIVQPVRRSFGLAVDQEYMEHAAVRSIEITGPYEVTGGAQDTPSRREIFTCHPRQGAQAQACATEILSRMARRAYRRSVTEQDVASLMEAFDFGRRDGGSFDTGIQFALEQMLVSPAFLLRLYRDPAEASPGQPYRLSDREVASRLSFFLWSSIPDEELLDLAESGRLTDPAVLEQQVGRMLTDPRAVDALVEDFAAQWLNVRRVEDIVPHEITYPHFDVSLLEALQRETELFVASTVRENRSVLDLLSADYTFLNERLARHYGVSGVYGSHFRRVTLPDREQRGGLLAQGALLAVSSYPDRTSPVLRGKWLLDNIIGAPPAPPPADVDTSLDEEPGSSPAGIRERLAQHRTDPVCATCHSVIDPLGFALENYDVLGGWRTVDETGIAVHTDGKMLDGVEIQGLAGLRAELLDHPEDFVRTVTEKLMAYALARRLDYYDQPTVRRIVLEAASDEYRWSSIILGIVKSPAFLMRTAAVRAD